MLAWVATFVPDTHTSERVQACFITYIIYYSTIYMSYTIFFLIFCSQGSTASLTESDNVL